MGSALPRASRPLRPRDRALGLLGAMGVLWAVLLGAGHLASGLLAADWGWAAFGFALFLAGGAAAVGSAIGVHAAAALALLPVARALLAPRASAWASIGDLVHAFPAAWLLCAVAHAWRLRLAGALPHVTRGSETPSPLAPGRTVGGAGGALCIALATIWFALGEPNTPWISRFDEWPPWLDVAVPAALAGFGLLAVLGSRAAMGLGALLCASIAVLIFWIPWTAETIDDAALWVIWQILVLYAFGFLYVVPAVLLFRGALRIRARPVLVPEQRANAVLLVCGAVALAVALAFATRGPEPKEGGEPARREAGSPGCVPSPRPVLVPPQSAARGDRADPESTAHSDDPPADPLLSPVYVEGRLLDPDGSPLAGIPVYLASADPEGYEHADQRILYTKGVEIESGLADARRYQGHGVTDGAGAYRLDAKFTLMISSISRGLRVVPSHPSWLEPKRSSGAEGGDMRVEPAASLTVRVVDAEGKPTPELRAVIREESRNGDHGIAATNGGFVVPWRRGGALPPDVDASLVIWARGRAIERRRVAVPAGQTSASITVELGPVQPDGRLVLRPERASVALRDRTVVVVLALPERPTDEILRVIATREGPEADGPHVADLHAGRYVARVWAWDAATHAQLLEDTVDVASGGTVERSWPPPGWRHH